MSIETLIEGHTAALNRNSDLLERVIAGQQAALDKIEGPKTTRAPKKTAESEGAAVTQAETPPPAAVVEEKPAAVAPVVETPPAAAAAAAPEVTDADIRAAATAWMDGTSVEERTAAAAKMSTILAQFGVGGKLTGPESVLDADQRKQARFYIQRWAAGLTVDFGADYDFDGEPTQGAAAPAEDPLG